MPSVGAKLKQEREHQGLTLDDVSASTKISLRMLTALEQDHFDQLPGGIFNKGFIRAYARVLGMDEEEVIADYIAATAPPEKESKPAPEDRTPELRIQEIKEDAGGLPWESFAVVLLIAAIGFAIWGTRTRGREKSTSPPANPPGQMQPAAAKPATPVMPNPAPAAGLVKPATPVAPALSLRITVENDCWVSIKADGREVLRDTLVAPAEKSITAYKQIIVRAGDISALDFDFNGKRLPPQGEEGEVKTVVFDTNGYHVALPPPQPTAAPPVPNPVSRPQP